MNKRDSDLLIRANYLFQDGQYQECENLTEEIYQNNNDDLKVLNLYASVCSINKNFDIAKTIFEKLVFLQPNNANISNNYAQLLRSMGDIELALIFFKKAVNYNPKLMIAYPNLFECLYLKENYKELHKRLQSLQKSNLPKSLGCVAISDFATNQLDWKKNPYQICDDQFDYIAYQEKEDSIDFFNENEMKELKRIIDLKLKNARNQNLLDNGLQTPGNLLDSKEKVIKKLRIIIDHRINLYKEKYNKKDCDLITKWPSSHSIKAWAVKIKKGGYLNFHNHEFGWISGSLYLKMPKVKNDEGKIEFSLKGPKYPLIDKSKLKSMSFSPKESCSIIFPSSLFHRTIPFDDNENRVSIAFDLRPN